MAYSEPTHPPIFPPGLHQMAIETLEETFVAPGFDTPLRRRLTEQLRLFVGKLAELGVHGDIWIDGSYVTKPDPRLVPQVLRALQAAALCLASCMAGIHAAADGGKRHFYA